MTDVQTIDAVRSRLSAGSPAGLSIGNPSRVGGLTLFPLFLQGESDAYITYAEALARGVVRIVEVGMGGSVPTLEVINDADVPVLLIEGEILAGVKQDRVLNTTVLVPPKATTCIPVACVEAGRWSAVTTVAGKAPYHLSPRARNRKLRSVATSVRAHGRYAADQHQVWDAVSERLRRHDVNSATRSYSDVGSRRRLDIERELSELRPRRDQAGILAFVGRAPLCLDLFERPATLRALWRGLVGSYVSDALVERGTGVPTAAHAERWIETLGSLEATRHDAVGLGSNVVMTGALDQAVALVVGTNVIHFAAVRVERPSGFEPRFVPPRGRRLGQ